jgi:hypothetical protein
MSAMGKCRFYAQIEFLNLTYTVFGFKGLTEVRTDIVSILRPIITLKKEAVYSQTSISTRLNGAISQKTVMFILTAVRT